MLIEFINPFVSSTHEVFQTMLGCTLTRRACWPEAGAYAYA